MRFLILIISIGLLSSCDPSKRLEQSPEYTLLDTMEISAPNASEIKTENDVAPKVYHASATRTIDLLHTDLDLIFDWKNEAVKGVAKLKFKPFIYPTSTVTLDAKGFDIHSIRMKSRAKSLSYDYDNYNLTINLDKVYTSMEEIEIHIDYTAFPSKLPIDGSEAINSDQGLFFINSSGENPDKPQQIWTQGETEYNSRWFPTIDKPNERCTQQIGLTVQDKFKTLSNGILVSSQKQSNGMRKDVWKLETPHAPYLFMIAVGDFAIVRDSWNNIPVEYYVEPKFEKDARNIFGNTKEMLSFFSNKLDYPYPWPKYSQIVVRDYVSGAMENTTAVIFGDFVQAESKELIDNNNDGIVAHEMIHHWFGDLVTCESWSNLTMNEGFASYGEYLWYEHKYGKDQANHSLRIEQEGYFDATGMGGVHPLIHFAYDDKEDMFDAHSYNKGGAVLHMLRTELGDDVFLKGLNKYLHDNKLSSVEVHDLRLAMEAVSGRDLNWFFNQWFLSKGHPEINISHSFDNSELTYTLTIEQVQDPEKHHPVFTLPLDVDIYLGKRMPIREKILVNKRKQSFSFPLSEAPLFVNVDPEKGNLWIKNEKRSESSYVFQYYNAKTYGDRFESIDFVVKTNHPKKEEIIYHALSDTFWVFRRKAIKELDASLATDEIWKKIVHMAENDPDSRVRKRALDKLGETGSSNFSSVLVSAVKKSTTYPEVASALSSLAALNPSIAEGLANDLASSSNMQTIIAVAGAYAKLGDPGKLEFFTTKLPLIKGFQVFPYYRAFTTQALSVNNDQAVADKLVDFLFEHATNAEIERWKRYCSARLIAEMGRELANGPAKQRGLSYLEKFQAIKIWEPDPQIKSIYNRF